MSNPEREEFLVLGWNDIVQLCLELSRRIRGSGFHPDVVVAILRGGYVVAKIVSDLLNVDSLATLEIKFYRGIGEKAERPIVVQPLTRDVKDRKVLIVDDVADSGRTLQVAIDLVRLHGAKDVRTATLFYKPWSIVMPDYFVEQTRKWIVFPWEIGETIRNLLSKDALSPEEVLKLLNLDKKFGNIALEIVRFLIGYSR